MSIFENRRLDLKKYSYITFMGYFGEMEHDGCLFLYYYMNKNRYKKFAQATRASAERRSGSLLLICKRHSQ
jgi:hypothetical protein